jgi:hypothetical protein
MRHMRQRVAVVSVFAAFAGLLLVGPGLVLVFLWGGVPAGMLTVAALFFIGMLIYFFAIRKYLAGSAEDSSPRKRTP